VFQIFVCFWRISIEKISEMQEKSKKFARILLFAATETKKPEIIFENPKKINLTVDGVQLF
jgi:hypothetical protein